MSSRNRDRRENRDRRRNRNAPPITIPTDNTATSPGPLPVNENVQYVLQPRADNQQTVPPLDRQPTSPFDYHEWMAQNTQPGDITSHSAYRRNRQLVDAAQRRAYLPNGAPLEISPRPPRQVDVYGHWHIGFLNQIYQARLSRENPDVVPLWSSSVLQNYDDVYRNQNVSMPGTVWPTAAVGMTMHLPQIRQMEASGICFFYIDEHGYVAFLWTGQQ